MADSDGISRANVAARLTSIAKFYLACIQAEYAAALAVGIDGNYLEAGAGFVEEGVAVPIPDGQDAAKWCATRKRDDPHGLVVVGWPVCVGIERESRKLSLSPLLIGDGRVVQDDDGSWRCERTGGGVDLNSAALGLLGFSDDERLAIEVAVAQSVAVEEAEGRRERTLAILQELTEHGIEGLAEVGTNPPEVIEGHSGVVNAAVLLPPASNSPVIHNLTEDLRELASQDETSGTLSDAAYAVLGDAAHGDTRAVKPTPTISHSSVQQDRAVHSAMRNPLTVVTGPPGSGKSQVVLNAVVAAVCRRETVLIASKNNKAVDVVIERLRATAPLCPVVRAGAASQRQTLANEIARLVGEAERAEPALGLVEANDQWHRVHRLVRSIHEARQERLGVLEEMQALESRLANAPLPEDVPDDLTEELVDAAAIEVRAAFRELDDAQLLLSLRQLEERTQRNGPQPEGVSKDIAPDAVEAAAQVVLRTLMKLSRSPGFFGRNEKRRLRMESVRNAMKRFAECAPQVRDQAASCVAQVNLKQPESDAIQARRHFRQIAAEAIEAAKIARSYKQLDDAKAVAMMRIVRLREALAAFGESAPHLRQRAEECLVRVEPAPTNRAVGKAAAMFERIVAEARRDAAALIERQQLYLLRKRTDELSDSHDSEDRLWALSEQRSKAGLALFQAKIRQMQTDRQEAWQAAGRLASRLRAVAKGTGRVSDVRALVRKALPAVPVWSITNLSARGTLPLDGGLFDLVVIDEASQCDAASALPLLVRGKRAMIIGDERQLPHITTLSERREEAISKRCGLDSNELARFGYRANSCFGLALSSLSRPAIMLDLHFRSHPAVVEFSNRQFYAGRMTMCGTARPPEGMSAIEWVPVSGRCQRGSGNSSWQNRAEASAVAGRVAADMAAYQSQNLSVGVVTPFAQQASAIRSELRRLRVGEGAKEIEVATAHRFQGGERDVIYFSPVIDEFSSRQLADFAADPNLLNVALTRARCRVVVVGSEAACRKHPNQLRDLAEHVAALEETEFDSPLERDLHAALRERGIEAVPGVKVGPYRLDLAVRHSDAMLDIECDGAPFHADEERDAQRDRALQEMGWTVVRFSGRRIKHRINECVREVDDLLRA